MPLKILEGCSKASDTLLGLWGRMFFVCIFWFGFSWGGREGGITVLFRTCTCSCLLGMFCHLVALELLHITLHIKMNQIILNTETCVILCSPFTLWSKLLDPINSDVRAAHSYWTEKPIMWDVGVLSLFWLVKQIWRKKNHFSGKPLKNFCILLLYLPADPM